MIELNRRTFLKGAGASGATCALASLLPGSLAALESKQLKGMGKEIASICEMCSTRCPISARVIEGKNVFIVAIRRPNPLVVKSVPGAALAIVCFTIHSGL